MIRSRLLAGACLPCLLLAEPVSAQDEAPTTRKPATTVNEAQNADASGTGDIIVTALKRPQALQDVPASVTTLSADLLAQGRPLAKRASRTDKRAAGRSTGLRSTLARSSRRPRRVVDAIDRRGKPSVRRRPSADRDQMPSDLRLEPDGALRGKVTLLLRSVVLASMVRPGSPPPTGNAAEDP